MRVKVTGHTTPVLSQEEELKLYDIILLCQQGTYDRAVFHKEGFVRSNGKDKYLKSRTLCFNAIMKLFHAEIEDETQSPFAWRGEMKVSDLKESEEPKRAIAEKIYDAIMKCQTNSRVGAGKEARAKARHVCLNEIMEIIDDSL